MKKKTPWWRKEKTFGHFLKAFAASLLALISAFNIMDPNTPTEEFNLWVLALGASTVAAGILWKL